ncbi:MAG: aminoglycoside 6-adenylyltransferase [Bacteroidetes bacterium]|nr:aminoglycoside 6-adenylyltransferase [Bacteroidota bacterium]
MRKENEIFELILNVAKSDERIRAVFLNGSRANPDIKPDIFQDFDIVYIVREFNSFLTDHRWTDVFGKKIIMQMPDEMSVGKENSVCDSFSYLMLFEDGNRIDLTLFPIADREDKYKRDSLTRVLMDKDNFFPVMPEPGDSDYHIKRPTEKEFSDCCNEFLWVSTYVAKALRRDEVIYAKELLENPVRKMFMKMTEWFIGAETNFKVNAGKSGRFMKSYIAPELYKKILRTYTDAGSANIWRSLFIMTDIFSELACRTAIKLHFKYDQSENKKVIEYLNRVCQMSDEDIRIK